LTPVPASSETELAKVPPPGSPPPLPPVPLNAIPPKVAEQAEEAVSKEVAKKDKKPKGTLPQRAWATVKKEAAHYWAGTKLLGHEIKISAKLIRVVLRGETLTRRERRQVSSQICVSTRVLTASFDEQPAICSV
jgi:LETM1 and EF-hand domain-containing protein 1